MRSVDVYLEVLRDGIPFSSLSNITTPRVSMAADAAIKCSLSATVLPNDNVNFLRDEVSPVLILDGEKHRLGVYAISEVSAQKNSSGVERLTFTAYDRCWRVQTVKWLGERKIGAGSNYIEAIVSLLIECGIRQVIKLNSDAVLPTDHTWDVGTDYLTIINELLAEINYKSLWFSMDGYAMLQPALLPQVSNIQHRLTTGDIRALLLPEINKETDVYNAPNVFICVCSSPDLDEPLVAKSVNDNPNSPLSVTARGREIYSFVQVRDIASEAELAAYADRLRWESMSIGETVVVRTALRPGHGVGDIVSLVYEDTQGIFIENEWSMDLKPGGQMQHTLRRVVFNNEH